MRKFLLSGFLFFASINLLTLLAVIYKDDLGLPVMFNLFIIVILITVFITFFTTIYYWNKIKE